jgi:hypothetical protein
MAGRLHDELAWRDVALRACGVLQTNAKAVFVTPWQMATDTAQLRHAMDDGYRVVAVKGLSAVARRGSHTVRLGQPSQLHLASRPSPVTSGQP